MRWRPQREARCPRSAAMVSPAGCRLPAGAAPGRPRAERGCSPACPQPRTRVRRAAETCPLPAAVATRARRPADAHGRRGARLRHAEADRCPGPCGIPPEWTNCPCSNSASSRKVWACRTVWWPRKALSSQKAWPCQTAWWSRTVWRSRTACWSRTVEQPLESIRSRENVHFQLGPLSRRRPGRTRVTMRSRPPTRGWPTEHVGRPTVTARWSCSPSAKPPDQPTSAARPWT
jgi:hypothetical protein